MRLIGLTGGIGSGKSTVSNYLKTKGMIIIDADLITKEVNKREDTIEELKFIFGEQILDGLGDIDSGNISELVFNNKENMELLQKIVLPKIISEMDRQVKSLKGTDEIVFLDVPLLFESNIDKRYDLKEIWLVSVPLEVQIDRIIKRNGYTKEHALARINNQMPLSEKAKRATVVIDNNEDVSSLYYKIDSLL